MFIAKETIETTATPEEVWEIWQDVANWNQWDPTVERSLLKGPFSNGTMGILKLKNEPEVLLRLAQVFPYTMFTSESNLFLAKVLFTHELEEKEGKTWISTQIDIKGLLSPIWAYTLGDKLKENLLEGLQNLVKLAEKS